MSGAINRERLAAHARDDDVVDERGAIHFFRKGLDSFSEYLARLCVFAENAAKNAAARKKSRMQRLVNRLEA